MPAYHALSSKEEIEVFVDGEKIDAIALGAILINLQRITEKVAYTLLVETGNLPYTTHNRNNVGKYDLSTLPQLTRVELKHARDGSFDSAWIITVLRVLQDPHAQAVLDGIAANIIWAIAKIGWENIKHKMGNSNYRYIIAERGIPDPYGIKAFVREMILAAEQNPNIKSIKIRVDQEGEVEIDLDYYRNENNNENIS